MSGGDGTIGRLEDVADGGMAAFTLEGPGGSLDVLVLRRGESALCYENACPHLGTPLDWVLGRFLAEDGRHFVCATHGALLRIEAGHCISGPGDALRPVAVHLGGGEVLAEL